MIKVQKVYDRKYNGRRIIVMWHSFENNLPEELKDDLMNWYCGYMEILAADKDYTAVNENLNPADEGCVEELYPSAIGGSPGSAICHRKALTTITNTLDLILTIIFRMSTSQHSKMW